MRRNISSILLPVDERKMKLLVSQPCPTLATPRTIAHQALLPMGFSRQEYWSGLQFPSPGDLSYPGIEPRSPALQADSLPTELQEKPTCSWDKLVAEDTGVNPNPVGPVSL